MPRFYDASIDYTFHIRIHPIIRMHFRQKGWRCLYQIADMCNVHIEDLCHACDVDITEGDLIFDRDMIRIYDKLGMSTADIVRVMDYKTPDLKLVSVRESI